MIAHHDLAPIAVLGAGGRVGRAVTAEAKRRGIPVTAIVRDPARYPDLSGPATVVAGDGFDAKSLGRTVADARALVSAVTPFTAPPESFDGFDTSFYARLADSLIEACRVGGVDRVVVMGLFAALHTPGNDRVLNDPALFPEALRPFARAHVAGIERLASRNGNADWIALSPPPGLSLDATPTGRYLLGDSILDLDASERPLAHADLAVAILDQIEHPTRHREHLSVYGT